MIYTVTVKGLVNHSDKVGNTWTEDGHIDHSVEADSHEQAEAIFKASNPEAVIESVLVDSAQFL